MTDEELKRILFIEFLQFIGRNNARTLRSESIITLLKNIQKYDLIGTEGNNGEQVKNVLFNLLPNISVIADENMEHLLKQSSEDIKKRFRGADNDDLLYDGKGGISEDQKTVRMLALDTYFKLYE